MARLFFSHASANNAEAIALRDWLVAYGFDDLFLDLDPERGLKAGEKWQAVLKRAAERCELVIFLVSPEWVASKWCMAEFLLAKNLNKRIFGVIVAPTPFANIPVEMTAEWQIVDLTKGKRDHKVTATVPPGDITTTVAFAKDGLDRLRIGLMQAGIDPRYACRNHIAIEDVRFTPASRHPQRRFRCLLSAMNGPDMLSINAGQEARARNWGLWSA